MASLRVLFIGGLISYRALFGWLNPWILIPTFLITPLFQILFFAFVGRTVGVGNDAFFLIGNAVLYAAIPCLFAMDSTISGERQQGTLALLLASPTRRIPLFLGRALPVILNGFAVAAVSLIVGALVLGVPMPVATWAPLILVIAVSTFSCAGLGMVTAALALRVRETAVLTNVVFAILILFAGVNVPLDDLPGWMAAAAGWMPMTHGIAAAHAVAAGVPLSDVSGNLVREAGLGLLYVAVGLALLAWFEREARRRATLEAY